MAPPANELLNYLTSAELGLTAGGTRFPLGTRRCLFPRISESFASSLTKMNRSPVRLGIRRTQFTRQILGPAQLPMTITFAFVQSVG